MHNKNICTFKKKIIEAKWSLKKQWRPKTKRRRTMKTYMKNCASNGHSPNPDKFSSFHVIDHQRKRIFLMYIDWSLNSKSFITYRLITNSAYDFA